MARIRFLTRVLIQRLTGQSRSCPYCRSADSDLVGVKKIVLELRRCRECGLMYRYPKDTQRLSHKFYQREYHEGMTTDVPDARSLETLKASGFRDTEKDMRGKIAVLAALLPCGKVLDYGCSWGYATYQLKCAGYETVGFEISRSRAEFGRLHLGVNILSADEDLDKLVRSFDAIFASHVLEHLSEPAKAFDRLASLLRPNGLLLAFAPNCGGRSARRLSVKWGPMCCEKHPVALDVGFIERALPRHGFQVRTFSNPYEPGRLNHVFDWRDTSQELPGDELMICARKLAAR